MSLLLAGLVFAGTSGALFVGRWIARRRKASESDVETKDPSESSEEKTDADEEQGRAEVESDVPTRKDDSSPKAPPAEGADAAARAKRRARDIPKGAQPRLDNARFVCQLGDVIMRHTGEEAWLAGGLVLSEQLPVAILFVAPDVGHDCGIYVRTRPKDSLWWLEQLDPTAVLVGGEPPSSVEHGGIRFERARRLPLRPRRIGVGAPDVGDAVVVAEYSSAGSERLLVLKANSGVVRAYRGLELEEGSFEVIASGESTLES